MYAAMYGECESIRLLLADGRLGVDATDDDGTTALGYTWMLGQVRALNG